MACIISLPYTYVTNFIMSKVKKNAESRLSAFACWQLKGNINTTPFIVCVTINQNGRSQPIVPTIPAATPEVRSMD